MFSRIGDPGSMDPLPSRRVSCPYCGAHFDTFVDLSAGSQRYVEDCHVCCHPIVFELQVGADGALVGLVLHREDE